MTTTAPEPITTTAGSGADAALTLNRLGTTSWELNALTGVAVIPGAPEAVVTLAGAARRTLRACTAARTGTPAKVTPASVVTEVANALLNGEDVPADAGVRYVSAEAVQATTAAQSRVVHAAAVDIGAHVRAMVAADGDYWLETVVRVRHDALLDRAHAAVVGIDTSDLLNPAALAAEGAGTLAGAYRELAQVHAELEPVRAAHAALLRADQGSKDQFIPGTGGTLGRTQRVHAIDCPAWFDAWPAWNSEQRPAPASPWDAGPVAAMVLLLRHGSWTPSRDELSTAWNAAYARDLAHPARRLFPA